MAGVVVVVIAVAEREAVAVVGTRGRTVEVSSVSC